MQLSMPQSLGQLQTYPWALVLDRNGVESGTREKLEPVSNTLPTLFNQRRTSDGAIDNPFLPLDASNGTGLLGSFETLYAASLSLGTSLQIVDIDEFNPTPFYNKVQGTAADIDNLISRAIRS